MSATRSKYTKGGFYEVVRISPGVDNLFSMRDEEGHKALKAKTGPAVSLSDARCIFAQHLETHEAFLIPARRPIVQLDP
jgi:hypothetical protein